MTILGTMQQRGQEVWALDILAHNAPSDERRRKYRGSIGTAEEAFSKAWQAFAPTVVGAEEQRLAHAVWAAWQHFRAVEAEAAALDRAGERDLADAVVAGDLQDDAAAFTRAVDAVRIYREARAVAAAAAADAAGVNARLAVIGAFAAALALGFGLGSFDPHRSARGVDATKHAPECPIEENPTGAVPATRRGDEADALADTGQTFRSSPIGARALEEQAGRIRAAAEKRRAVLYDSAERFAASIGGVIETVAAAATALRGTADLLARTAGETPRPSAAMAAADGQTRSSVQLIVAAADELGASVGAVRRQAEMTAAMADGAAAEAMQSTALVQALSGAASQIGSVIDDIAKIAAQTNLLALNAAIEAGRAGDAGRGFAVVAAEVKALAGQTKRATDDIAGHITVIQDATAEAVAVIDGITTRVGDMSRAAASIATAVEDQGAATLRIVDDVAQVVQQTGADRPQMADAAGTAEAADGVLTVAGALASDAERLTDEVARFLQTIRSASYAAEATAMDQAS